MNRIRLAAKQENLDKFITVISNFAEQNDFSPEVIRRIKLSLEEALVNIMNYAYPENEGEVAVYYRKKSDTELILEIFDNGISLNPLSTPKPNFTATLSERKVGGLGVFFIRKMTEDVHYRRQGDANILTLIYSK
jgi:anti-sigma regulatory factor (Ser/Thr protein kinase)